MVLPQIILDQISIAPWRDQHLPREKRELNKQQKRHTAKRAGHPECQRKGEKQSTTEL
jgi:hypothetical protein